MKPTTILSIALYTLALLNGKSISRLDWVYVHDQKISQISSCMQTLSKRLSSADLWPKTLAEGLSTGML